MNNDHRCKAVSLIELLIIIAVIGILAAIAKPNFKHWLVKVRVANEVNRLVRYINNARESAIYLNQIVTLCPISDNQQCGKDWSKGMRLFIDTNTDQFIDANEQVISQHQGPPQQDKVYWRAFRNKAYLQMSPLGFTRFQNGTFTYCPEEGLNYAKGIILNAAGRVRLTEDANKDGIDEGANGKPLRC